MSAAPTASPLEPVTGFEPAQSDWKSDVLPLHNAGIVRAERDSNLAVFLCAEDVFPETPSARIHADGH